MNTTNTSKPQDCPDPPGLLSVDEAKGRILEYVHPVGDIETVKTPAALGRVLAEDVHSSIDVPPYDNSAMDGYAVRAADLTGDGESCLQNIGTSYAGKPFTGTVQAGQCIRIMTGAVIPPGTDTVVMQEHVRAEGDHIWMTSGYKSGQNVRRAGEDIRAGEQILEAGTCLLPAHLGVLASVGVAQIPAVRRLRAAFFSTGDELRGVGEVLEPGQIYDSNRYTLSGMLSRMGVEVTDWGVVPDDRARVRETMEKAAKSADVIITSGGVSVGEADYVTELLEELGEVHFWRAAMKPGKPIAVGRVGDSVFFGLPGNPVSVMVTFYQFARPAMQRMAGMKPAQDLLIRIPTFGPLEKNPGRLEYQRGILEYRNGRLGVTTTGLQGSHVLSSMARADCFIVLPAESAGAEAGELVDVQPFAGVI